VVKLSTIPLYLIIPFQAKMRFSDVLDRMRTRLKTSVGVALVLLFVALWFDRQQSYKQYREYMNFLVDAQRAISEQVTADAEGKPGSSLLTAEIAREALSHAGDDSRLSNFLKSHAVLIHTGSSNHKDWVVEVVDQPYRQGRYWSFAINAANGIAIKSHEATRQQSVHLPPGLHIGGKVLRPDPADVRGRQKGSRGRQKGSRVLCPDPADVRRVDG
jgi:hypothetical protein